MWPRHVEATLGCWLAVSPFVFRHPAGAMALWAHDLAGGLVLVVVALLTYRPSLRRLHLLLLPLAGWLCAIGWIGAPAPAAQNHLVVGFLLAMVAIVPTDATEPPIWRRAA